MTTRSLAKSQRKHIRKSFWRTRSLLPIAVLLKRVPANDPLNAYVAPSHELGSLYTSSRSSAMGCGIVLAPVIWAEGVACGCRHQSRRADGSRHVRSAVAGVCRSRQTASDARSSSASSVRTSSRSRKGCGILPGKGPPLEHALDGSRQVEPAAAHGRV
jgi:hypothetical protein